MSRHLENTLFVSSGRKWLGKHAINGLTVRSCRFVRSGFGLNSGYSLGALEYASRLSASDCVIEQCVVFPCLLRDCSFENLSGDMLIVWGALFERVTLAGSFSPLMIHGLPRGNARPNEIAQHQELARLHYSACDWALDISNAQFADFSIRTFAIPTNLVKINPETQLVIPRWLLDSPKTMDKLKLSEVSRVMLQDMKSESSDDGLLVAPVLNRQVGTHVFETLSY